MDSGYKYMVCTRCFTYNHAQYIEDTLRGFCMQETTFPVVYCIVDDASTDGEQEVLKTWAETHLDLSQPKETQRKTDYGELIVAKQKEKANQLFVILLLSENHKQVGRSKLQYLLKWIDNSKYLALCEGDDYWIHPRKLQMQVVFLETNPNYGLVYSNRSILKSGQLTNLRCSGKCDFDSLIYIDEIPTLTTCFRRELDKRYYEEVKPSTKGWKMGDLPRWLFISYYSKVKFFNEVFAVYRDLPNSASHSTNIDKAILFIKSGYEIRDFLIESLVKDTERKDKLHRLVKEECYVIPIVRYYSKRGYYKEAKEVLLNDWNHIQIKTKVRCLIFLLFAFLK